ncbi:MAG TPA: sigma-70 family RNA polymerase sigma factor [Chitinophagaceae bacterium]|nr:sigma-70 family RNA polymerase sigma factor [Chitinophagaceae bacterium]
MKNVLPRIIENEISYFQIVNPKLHKHLSDQELLERFYADRDNQWLGILLERYTLLLLGVCMKYLKNEELARDSVQQIFLKAITELQKYRVEYFKSWIYMVAKNHCLMQLRDKPGKNTVEVRESIPAESEETDKEDLLLNEKTYDYLSEALKELNADQQLCVTLFYIDRKSYQQISEQTGYTMMQVKSYIQNGKRNMKIIIEKKLKEHSQ